MSKGPWWLERDVGEWFGYDVPYLRRGDSTPHLPIPSVMAGRFDSSVTRAAFLSLGPEGRVGHRIRTMLLAARELEGQYGVAAMELASRMLDDSAERLKVVFRAAKQLWTF